MAQPIKLEFDDPTIFAKCSGRCTRSYPGKKVGDYFAKAYTVRKWKRGQVCDNCGSKMAFLFEVTT